MEALKKMGKLKIIFFTLLLVLDFYPFEKIYQNTRQVRFSFLLTDMKPFLKVKKLVLWVTEDNGINWYKAEKFTMERNDKGQNFIKWEASKDGNFGFILSYELENLRESYKPSIFDLPQYQVFIDTKKPKVVFFKARYLNKKQGILKLKWKVVDKNLASQTTKLLYQKNGEFQVISDNLMEEGEITWYLTDTSQKHLKFLLETSDLVGNKTQKILKKINSKFAKREQEKHLFNKPAQISKAQEEPVTQDTRLKEESVTDKKEEKASEISQHPLTQDTKLKEEHVVKKVEEMTQTTIEEKKDTTQTTQKDMPVTSTFTNKTKERGIIPIRIPINIQGDKEKLSGVTVYYTSNKGKTWRKYAQLSPYEENLLFYAEKEKLYGFYFVFRTKDGLNFPEEPVAGTVPNIYKYIDITAPGVKLYTPKNIVFIAGKIYKIGWKIYDKNLDISKSKLSVSMDNGKTWHLLAKSLSKKGKMDFRAPDKDLDNSLIFKLEAKDLSNLSSSITSKTYTVRKYDFKISFSHPTKEKGRKTKKSKKVLLPKKEEVVEEKKPSLKLDELLKEAKTFISKGEYYEALQNLNTIVENNPNDIEALSLIGYIHTLQGNYPEGIKVLSQIFSLDCSDFTTFYNLQISLIKVNNIFDSITRMSEFLRCTSIENLDKNKREKIQAIIAILEKKSNILEDNNLKNKLNYIKNLIAVSLLSAKK